MITSSPLGSTWLISLASGNRAGAAAAVAGGPGCAARCCVSTLADSVEGDNKVNRSKRTSKLRFTDISMLDIDVSRGEKVILRDANCTGCRFLVVSLFKECFSAVLCVPLRSLRLRLFQRRGRR